MNIQEMIKTIQNDILLAKKLNGQVEGWSRKPELCLITIHLIEVELKLLEEEIG